MPWQEFDPQKVADMVERYLGKIVGGLLIRITILGVTLGAAGYGLLIFFKDFLGFTWAKISELFGVTAGGVTFSNLEAIITTLVIALAVLVVAIVVFAWLVYWAFRRRVVPQTVIDELAELRAGGIEVLNMMPDNPAELSEAEIDNYLSDTWNPAWRTWRTSVEEYLGKHFTVAERLSFEGLGTMQLVPFAHALNSKHDHWLRLLSKQLAVLESIIQRHLERQ